MTFNMKRAGREVLPSELQGWSTSAVKSVPPCMLETEKLIPSVLKHSFEESGDMMHVQVAKKETKFCEEGGTDGLVGNIPDTLQDLGVKASFSPMATQSVTTVGGAVGVKVTMLDQASCARVETGYSDVVLGGRDVVDLSKDSEPMGGESKVHVEPQSWPEEVCMKPADRLPGGIQFKQPMGKQKLEAVTTEIESDTRGFICLQAKKITPTENASPKFEGESCDGRPEEVMQVVVRRKGLKRCRSDDMDSEVAMVTERMGGTVGLHSPALHNGVTVKTRDDRIASVNSLESRNRINAFNLIREINSVGMNQTNHLKRTPLDVPVEQIYVQGLTWANLKPEDGGSVIGTGMFGTVRKWVDDKQKVYISKDLYKSTSTSPLLEPNEVLVPLDLAETGVIPRVCGLKWDGVRATILQEYAGICLRSVIEESWFKPILDDSTKILKIMLDICEALEVLHKFGIVYRDAKPENTVYDRETRRVKLIDLGSSRTAQDNARESDQTLSGSTPEYLPPYRCRQFLHNLTNRKKLIKLNKQDDVWGAGMIGLFLVMRCHAVIRWFTAWQEYPQNDQMQHRMATLRQYAALEHQLPEAYLQVVKWPQLKTLLQGCLSIDEGKRWTAAQCVWYLQDCLRSQPKPGGKRMKMVDVEEVIEVDDNDPCLDLDSALTRRNLNDPWHSQQESNCDPCTTTAFIHATAPPSLEPTTNPLQIRQVEQPSQGYEEDADISWIMDNFSKPTSKANKMQAETAMTTSKMGADTPAQRCPQQFVLHGKSSGMFHNKTYKLEVEAREKSHQLQYGDFSHVMLKSPAGLFPSKAVSSPSFGGGVVFQQSAPATTQGFTQKQGGGHFVVPQFGADMRQPAQLFGAPHVATVAPHVTSTSLAPHVATVSGQQKLLQLVQKEEKVGRKQHHSTQYDKMEILQSDSIKGNRQRVEPNNGHKKIVSAEGNIPAFLL